METLFAVLILLSFLALIVGLVHPEIVIRWGSKRTRSRVLLIYGSAMLIFLILFGITSPPEDKTVEVTPPKVERGKKVETQKLGVSYDQMMSYLSNVFTMKKLSPIDGQDRYWGKTDLAILEIIGDRKNITQTSLTLFILKEDDFKALLSHRENSAILLRFLKNAVPEWELEGIEDWAIEALKKIGSSSGNRGDEEKVYGDKLITISMYFQFNMIFVSVKHK